MRQAWARCRFCRPDGSGKDAGKDASYSARDPDTNHASSITYINSDQPLLTRDKQGKGLRHNVSETPSPPSSPITRYHPPIHIFYRQSFTSLPGKVPRKDARHFVRDTDSNHASSITYTNSDQPHLTRDKQGKGLRHNLADTPSPPSPPITRSLPLLRIFYRQSFTSLPTSAPSQSHPHLSIFDAPSFTTPQVTKWTCWKRKQPATLPNPTHPSPSLSQTRAMPILDLKTHPQHPDLAGFHQLVDVNQHRRWAFLFIVIGMNSNSCVTP